MAQHLPKQFRTSHEFAFFLHDILAGIVVEGEKADIFQVPVTFRSQADTDTIERLSGDELWNWLQTNGYEWVNVELAYKQLVVALLADFCQFVHEALRCSEKGKLAVTYTLLRKPFKDNLFYLEWLLVDPVDFLKKFRNESPEGITLSMSNDVSKQRRLEIIQFAIDKTSFSGVISAEFIYDLRYNKAMARGFEPLWNKAAHLVTTVKHYATERQNINFVFSGDDARLDQWTHIYSLLPILLFHAVEVVEVLVKTMAARDETEDNFFYARKVAGLEFWSRYSQTDNTNDLLTASMHNSLQSLGLECPTCGKPIVFGKRNLRSFYLYGKVICGSCRTDISWQ